jgi:hypothetical protein
MKPFRGLGTRSPETPKCLQFRKSVRLAGLGGEAEGLALEGTENTFNGARECRFL